MNDLEKTSKEGWFLIALGLMAGMVLTLILTWLLSGSSMAEEKPRSIENEVPVVAEAPESPKEAKKIVNAKPKKEGTKETIVLTPSKMQVFYIGVENPLTISTSEKNSEEVRVYCNGCKIKGRSERYIVTVQRPGEVKISVSVSGKPPQDFLFRAKRIPDPVARLGNSTGGAIDGEMFKAQQGLGNFLDNFDFDAKCQVQGFELYRIPKKQDFEKVVNLGARYNNDAKALISLAKPGDIYHFINVKVKCPGDAAGRKINSLVFMIK